MRGWTGCRGGQRSGVIERAGLELMLADLVADTVEIKSVIYYAQLHDRAVAGSSRHESSSTQ